MKCFGNKREDYYANAMADYPVAQRVFYYVAASVVGLWNRILWPWKIEGVERLFPKPGEHGLIIVMNHCSMIEPCVTDVVFLWNHRRIRPVYKSEFDNVSLMGWFLAVVGGISISRGTADLKALRDCQHALERGESVLIYPEGTRVYNDQQNVEVHGGFAVMSRMAKADIVPVAVVGCQRKDGKGGMRRPGRIYLKVGERLSLDDVEGETKKKKLINLERVAMERVYALRDELRREHPGKL